MGQPTVAATSDIHNAQVRLVVTDELGLIKGLEANSVKEWETCKVASRWGEPSRQLAVEAMCLSSRGGFSDTESALLAVSRSDMSVQVMDPITGRLFADIPKKVGQKEKVSGLSILWEGISLAARDCAVLSCTGDGLVRMHSPKDEMFRSMAVSEWDEVTSWSIGQACDCMAVNPTAEQIAIGGLGTEMAVYDMVTQKRIFQAKGAKKDFLGLQDKPWVSCLAWIPGGDNRKVVVGTGSSKLRLYDLATDMRRPVLETSFTKGQTKVTSVAPNFDGSSVWAANGAGTVQLWDIKANKMMDVLKGAGGSVRSLSLHPEEPLIASVGLDRWLRVHHTGTKKQLAKVYLKQQLTGVTWCPSPPPVVAPGEAAREEPETEAKETKRGKSKSKSKSESGKSKKRKQR